MSGEEQQIPKKSVEEYLRLPYTIEVYRDDDEENPGWVARVLELPGCITQGDTFEELGEMIEDAMRGWIEVALKDNQEVPEPRLAESFSGKFIVRVSRSLHHKLVEAARREGVSLNHFCSEVLAEAVGQHKSTEKLQTRYQPSHEKEKRAPNRVIAESEGNDYSKMQ